MNEDGTKGNYKVKGQYMTTDTEADDKENLIVHTGNKGKSGGEPLQLEIKTQIPKILDSYEFSRFHLIIVIALGTTWILDGYEVCLVNTLSGYFVSEFKLANTDVGILGSVYLYGAVSGAIFFGHCSSKLGRKSLFSVTLIIYIISIFFMTLSSTVFHFALCRFFTGVAVGGEYSAIFSAIDELLPAYVRGRVDLIIDGTWHLGSAMASILTYLCFKFPFASKEIIMRTLFSLGVIVSLYVLYLRKSVPESPRWLIHKGRLREAVSILQSIDSKCKVRQNYFYQNEKSGNKPITDDICLINYHINLLNRFKSGVEDSENDHEFLNFFQIFSLLYNRHFRRFTYALVLMTTQAIFYVGIFYSYNQVLVVIEKVPKEVSSLYLIPLSVASFIGPLMLGNLFDTYSRRKMIFITNSVTFILTLIIAINFKTKMLPFFGENCLFFLTFVFASPAASSAHLTVSEIFPLELRTQVLSVFFGISYGVAAIFPFFFSWMIDSGSSNLIFLAYILVGACMGFAGCVSLWYGLDTENKSLEEINDLSIIVKD